MLLGVGLLVTAGCISFDVPEGLERDEHSVAGWEADERGDFAAAIEAYTKSIELEPTAAAYVGRAYAQGSLDEIEAAIADLTLAVELDDANPAAFNQRALYYNQQERWAEALADLDRAIELRPDRGDPYNGRALAHLNLGNLALAAEDATKAIGLDPNPERVVSYYLNRATAY